MKKEESIKQEWSQKKKWGKCRVRTWRTEWREGGQGLRAKRAQRRLENSGQRSGVRKESSVWITKLGSGRSRQAGGREVEEQRATGATMIFVLSFTSEVYATWCSSQVGANSFTGIIRSPAVIVLGIWHCSVNLN